MQLNNGTPCSESCNKCTARNCQYCPKLDISGRITSSSTGCTYYCKSNVTCKSSNLIYCITCKSCHKQYVGQTGNTLMTRMQGHFAAIKRRDCSQDTGKHFNLPRHHGLADVQISVLDFIYAPVKADFAHDLRLEVEYNWIHTLRTTLPQDLNSMEKAPAAPHCRNVKHATA